MMLRTSPLPSNQQGLTENPVYWVIVGILEWISHSLPSEEDVRMVSSDLRIINLVSTIAWKRLIGQVTQDFLELMLPSLKIS